MTVCLVEEIRSRLLFWYLQIRFFHLLMVATRSFSTAVAFRDYLAPAFRAWSRNSERRDLIARRDEANDCFDNFGGSRRKFRTAGNTQRYRQMILLH
jgi:hypothetical protein